LVKIAKTLIGSGFQGFSSLLLNKSNDECFSITSAQPNQRHTDSNRCQSQPNQSVDTKHGIQNFYREEQGTVNALSGEKVI
jgi:hypothetical protein